jgi:hypothetical protein
LMRVVLALLLSLFIGQAVAQVNQGTSPLSIPKGGTGAATAAAARTSLGITATGADTTYAYRANNLSDLASASSARTNLGLAIGSNVEAWDADLDCLAALATTGILRRTGSGACSAGTVALSDLATGTQDTVIGYFGATTGAAATLPNCSNSLTYSTSTHSFGCNVSAGTGTVTSVTCFGTAITSTGTCATAATKSDEQTGSSTTAVVTPSQQQQHDSSVKAWGAFNGSGAAFAAYNMSASGSAGVYTLTFSTAFATTGYQCQITAVDTASAKFGFINGSKTTTSVSIAIVNTGGTATAPNVGFDVACSGRL